MADEVQKGCVVTRRDVLLGALGIASAAAVLKPAPAQATFGEDVAVLLAQLEQQLQIVSNAIATVQNLVQTVQHLSNVVQNGKQLLERATSKGGLKSIYADLSNGQGGLNGVLNAANNVTGLALDTIGDLNVIGDAVWDDWYKWQSSADTCRNDPACARNWSYKIREASEALKHQDPLRLRSMRAMARAFKGLRKLYDVHKESMEAAADAQQEKGVVGVLQMISRQEAHAMTASVKAAEMAGISAQIQADEYTRQAAERENQRQMSQQHLDSLGVMNKSAPVDVGWTIGAEQWEP